MKNLSTWLLVMFMGMFWVFRIIVTFMSEFGKDFGGFSPLNIQIEIILLFIVLLCMILIVKRKMLGAYIYLIAYGLYFGADIFNKLGMIINSTESNIGIGSYSNLFISFLGMLLPVLVLVDLLVDKGRKVNPIDNKTDWFYKNEEFDRKMDERSDKNNYRTL